MLSKIITVLLLCTHGKLKITNSVEVSSTLATDLENNVDIFSNSSRTYFKDVDEDTEMVEAQPSALPQPTQPTPPKGPARNGRQLLYNPGIQSFIQTYAEGGKCVTPQGITGSCLNFGSCPQYFRFRRQLTYITIRQWPSAVPQQGFCSFYDVYGRPNSGICCTNSLDMPTFGFGGTQPLGPPLPPPHFVPIRPVFGVGGALPPVRPMPPPPLPPAGSENPNREDTEDEEDTQGNHNGDDDNIETNGNLNKPQNAFDSQIVDSAMDNSPHFQDENSVDHSNGINDAQPTPITYDDYRYGQWPTQFGHFSGVAQWPPPLPTHPPSTANWPPPIPTHPPNHHYPTHPPTQTRPTTPGTTMVITTKRIPTTLATTRRTTARPITSRPSYPGFPSYPSYPGYPGYPGYPSYPSYRPTTTTPRPITRPTSSLITTTRKPSNGVSTGTSQNGLPLQCGVKNPVSPDQERIVGGSNASPHEFPWIAVLFKSGKQFCGGTLITHNHILTAAHCVARMTSWDVAAITAHLGDYNIRTDFEVKHVERRIKRLVRHKGFDFSTLHNDIAILTLNEPVKFTYEIQPICLPTSSAQQSRSYTGQQATVAGWGSLRENGPQPSILQKVQIPIWSNSDCARKYGRAAPAGIIESMICAGQAAKDSCSGDSGGPLIVNDGGRYTQVGVVSWGIGCGKGQYPGVYTRVTALLPWIYKNIK